MHAFAVARIRKEDVRHATPRGTSKHERRLAEGEVRVNAVCSDKPLRQQRHRQDGHASAREGAEADGPACLSERGCRMSRSIDDDAETEIRFLKPKLISSGARPRAVQDSPRGVRMDVQNSVRRWIPWRHSEGRPPGAVPAPPLSILALAISHRPQLGRHQDPMPLIGQSIPLGLDPGPDILRVAIYQPLSCLSQSPSAVGNSSGSTKYHRNICTSSGMLRNSST
jgi:hypothetical protein